MWTTLTRFRSGAHAFGLALLLQQSALSQSSISGFVVDESGIPQVGARVAMSLRAGPPPELTTPGRTRGLPQAYRKPAPALTDQSGSFSLTVESPGYVQLCPVSPSAGTVDICLWDPLANIFLVRPGQALANLRLVIHSSARLAVLVDDPKGLLGPDVGARERGPSPELRVEVLSPVLGPLLANVRPVAGGREYVMDVPVNFSVSARLTSASLRFAAAGGTPTQSAAFTVTVPRRVPQAIHRFSITDRR